MILTCVRCIHRKKKGYKKATEVADTIYKGFALCFKCLDEVAEIENKTFGQWDFNLDDL
jgi:hypothetical protein